MSFRCRFFHWVFYRWEEFRLLEKASNQTGIYRQYSTADEEKETKERKYVVLAGAKDLDVQQINKEKQRKNIKVGVQHREMAVYKTLQEE